MKKDHFHITLPKGYKMIAKLQAARRSVSISRLFQIALEILIKKENNEHGKKVTKID